MKEILINPAQNTWEAIIQRPSLNFDVLRPAVSKILEDVKVNGDSALRKYALDFDAITLDEIKVTPEEIELAESQVPDALKSAIAIATRNIWKFHEAQVDKGINIETTEGITCWRKSVPIEKVGLYIPGGSAPLFSTLLMLGIPAVIAGCKEIVVCTPAGNNNIVPPAILYVAKLLGIDKIFKSGGSQAIAAMAYGTSSIPGVYKIFGPGNQYVTCAKQLVSLDGVAIDMPAGPSEIAIYADETSNPSFVASDLLSQAEHGRDSQVLVVSSSTALLENITKEIMHQVESLPRKTIALQSLHNSHFIVMENVEDAFRLLNMYAPEHLIIASDNANKLSDLVVNAGSVFIGHYSPESAGDYASGTNHTLPTNGYAKSYSGVSVDSFVKKITFQKITEAGLENIGDAVEAMAAAEGLEAHKRAVAIRREFTNKQ